MVWLAGEAGIQTNLASLAAAGLSLAIQNWARLGNTKYQIGWSFGQPGPEMVTE